MGEAADQALSDSAATRAALERDIDELFRRLPEPAELAARAKLYGGAAAGAITVLGVAAISLRKRSRQQARRREARINAEELARAFSSDVPRTSGGRSGPIALVVAGAALGLTVVNLLRGRSD